MFWSDSRNRERILSLVEPSTSGVLLDLGCGDGLFTLRVSQKMGCTQIIGIDNFYPDILLARKNLSGSRDIYEWDLNRDFPWTGPSLDVILANQIIEHLYDPDHFLSEIYRFLKPGGYAVISTPNLGAWHNLVFLLMGWQPPMVDVSSKSYAGNPLKKGKIREGNLGHIRLFTYGAFRDLLHYHGFKIDKLAGSRHSTFLTARVVK
jgi:SAM-dependent methyltransferase